MMAAADASDDWHVVLRAERRRLRLTQADLARRAGVAPETLRKYESGDRTPSRSSIERILAALAVPQPTVRAVLHQLGYAARESLRTFESDPDYEFTVPQMRSYAEDCPWPHFGVNNVLEIVSANAPAQALWDIDFDAEVARRSRAQLNFLAITAERRFSRRIVNWEQAMQRLVAILKAVPQSRNLLDDPTSLFGEVFAAFAANDPAAIPTLFALWERTPPAPAKVRWNYPIIWREPGYDDIRFLGIVTSASETDALGFNDWLPVDATSHATLERIVEARTTLRSLGGEPGPAKPNVPPRGSVGPVGSHRRR